MQIIRDEFYLFELEKLIDYIANNSVAAAINFLETLDRKIKTLKDS